MPQALCRRTRLYQWMWLAISRRASYLVASGVRLNSSHSSVEENASAAALSKDDPARPIDWLIPQRWHARANS